MRVILVSDIPQQIGQIDITNFVNPGGLKALEKIYINKLRPATAHQFKARLAGHGAFGQGQLEGSNVTIVDEMVNMITPKDSMKPIQRLCKLLIRCCSQQIT